MFGRGRQEHRTQKPTFATPIEWESSGGDRKGPDCVELVSLRWPRSMSTGNVYPCAEDMRAIQEGCRQPFGGDGFCEGRMTTSPHMAQLCFL